MMKLIFKIGVVNIGLFILLILVATLIAFGLGYGSRNSFNRQMLILYVLTGLVQIGINYLIYKKQVASDWRIFLVIILTVMIIYGLYPLVMQ